MMNDSWTGWKAAAKDVFRIAVESLSMTQTAARKAAFVLIAFSTFFAVSQLSAQSKPTSSSPGSKPSIVGYWAGEDAITEKGDRKATSPSSYYEPAYRGSLTPEVWQTLAQYHVPLYLNIRYGRDFGPIQAGAKSDVVELVRKANSLHIPISAWVVVSYEQGYWAYQGNPEPMFTAVKAWDKWKKANRLEFVSVAIDQEFSWQNLQTFIAGVTSRDPEKLKSWMRSNIDPATQCKAFHAYQALIAWAHRNGIQVDAAEAPMVADDLADGKLALQNAFQITGSSPGYDQMFLMAYRSAAAQAGFDPGSAYAASYYASMQKYFGAIGQVSLGIPGQAPYDKLAPLVNDVRMLVGLGATRIPIYSLEEMVTKFGPDGLKSIAEAAQQPTKGEELAAAIKPTPITEAMLGSSTSQDATAVELTLAVSKEQGHPQSANSWPSGCGDLSVPALAKGRP